MHLSGSRHKIPKYDFSFLRSRSTLSLNFMEIGSVVFYRYPAANKQKAKEKKTSFAEVIKTISGSENILTFECDVYAALSINTNVLNEQYKTKQMYKSLR